MGNNIVEENPAQQSNAPSGPQGQGAGGGEEKIRKQARQLAYDVRYKVKQGFKDGQKTDPASLKRAFLSQLGKSPAPGPVKGLAKKMLVGEAYDFTDVSETVSGSIANAIKSIFVENKKCCEECGSYDHVTADCPDKKVNEALQEKKYKVRVTDKKTGKSYTRFADRGKISELRKNPNISSVEMTGYGTPYEGEKNKGEQTAATKSGKGLAKKDYDGDGKKESPTAEYKGSKDKAIKKALHKEEFIDEVNTENDNPNANTKKVDVMKGENKIIINPNMGEQASPASQEEKLKNNNDLAGAPKPKEDSRDKRIRMVKRQILQKKIQAVRSGAGSDIQASHTPEGEVIKEYDNTKAPDYDKKKKALAKKHGGEDKIKGHPQYESSVQSALDSLNLISEKEVKVKDTKKVVDAIRAYDKSKDASKDADWDTEHGEKEKGDKEKKYAKKERGEIDKDDPNWKKKKYHTGMHGESYENEPPIKDQSDKQIADVTFDGGGPDGGATIKGTGDPREIPTFVALIKNKLRARGILVAHNELEGEQLDELNKRERVEAGQGKRAAKKGDWSKQKANTGRRNINRFETKPVEREHGTLDKGKQSFKKVKVLNPKSGYSKKTDPTKGKVTSRKLSQTGTDTKPDYGPQKPHWAGNVHSDRAQQQRRSEHKARQGVKTKGTVASDIKKSMKETLVQSAVDSLDSIAKKEGLI